jgi:hypothetical protein
MICTSVMTSLRSGHQGTLQPAADPKLLAHGLLAAFHGWSRWRPAPRPAGGRGAPWLTSAAGLLYFWDLRPTDIQLLGGERQNPEEARA